jgi:hypothetical protein
MKKRLTKDEKKRLVDIVMGKKKNRLIQDNSGHWYVIPAVKKDEFYEWCDKMERDLPCGWPEWLNHIDGPHCITFDEYTER